MQTNPSANLESLAGLVERVTFHNEETGFAVLKVAVKGRRELVSVVGSLASAQAGEWLTAEGRWLRDREHGLQFKSEKLQSTPPTTREGIEKYLGSGLVKGIGPAYARKLVGHFGEKIFDIIENSSAKLEEVDGIGPGRRKKIKEAWQEQKTVRQIMVFLHSHGVSTSRALRIFKTYGEAAIEKVRGNPYALAQDIPGIGFKTADQIAQRVGIPLDSQARCMAGLRHALLEATQEGHCALPRSNLLERGERLLNQPEALMAQALAALLRGRELLEESLAGENFILLPALQRAEAQIASRLVSMARRPPAYPALDLEKALEWAQKKTGKALSATQKQALATVLAQRVVIITGGPGVGKTTLVNSVLLILKAKKVRCLLCAPTGRAAKRLAEATGCEAQTIHRLLEYHPRLGRFSRNEENPLEADLIIVDETSMLDVPLMNHLLRAVAAASHLVLVGDVDQLPSVGPGSVLADLIGSGRVPTVRLSEIFRQAAHSRIISAAHAINQGCAPPLPAKEEESDFYFIERDQPEEAARTLLELVKRRIPGKWKCDPIRDVQVLCPMNRGSLGVRELNLRLQNELNPGRPEEPSVEKFGWQFRVRDKVIQTENDYDKGVFNGDIGEIARIDPMERELAIRFDSNVVIYDFGELDEIALAYALTVHKAQGSEFPVVVIPIHAQHYLLLQRNLLYTAITRGRQLVVLVGQKKALSMAVRNSQPQHRFSGLRERLLAIGE